LPLPEPFHGKEKDGEEFKLLQVRWAREQGKEQYVNRWRDSPLVHQNVPEEARPMLFEKGQHVAFPEPTRTLMPRGIKGEENMVDSFGQQSDA